MSNGFLWVFGQNSGSRCAPVRRPRFSVLRGHVARVAPIGICDESVASGSPSSARGRNVNFFAPRDFGHFSRYRRDLFARSPQRICG